MKCTPGIDRETFRDELVLKHSVVGADERRHKSGEMDHQGF